MPGAKGHPKPFDIVNFSLMVVLCFFFVYPFVYTAAISFSSPTPILQGKVVVFPVGFTTSAYKAIFRDRSMIRSFLFTVELTVFGVLGSLIATTFTAYPLSKRNLKGKNVILNLVIFTMYFSGGLIPTYLVVKGVGLIDRMGALVLPNLINSFLLFIMINFFRGIPVEMEESSRLDGANNLQVLWWIVVPLSMPIMATLVIYYAVSYWNTFFAALVYMSTPDKYTLQVKLYLMLNATDVGFNSAELSAADVLPENLKGAVVITTALPILLVYPFLQRHFVKGVTIGALKG